MPHLIHAAKRAVTWLGDVELAIEDEYLPSLTREDRLAGRGT